MYNPPSCLGIEYTNNMHMHMHMSMCMCMRMCMCIARLAGGGAEKRNLLAIAMVLQAAPGDDDLLPPGPPRHNLRCLMFDDSNP